MIKGIIFDLDGTLIDSMPLWNSLCVRFLNAQGIHAPEGLNDLVKAMSPAQSSAYLQAQFLPDWTAEQVQRGIDQMIEEHYVHDTLCKPYVPELLNAAQAHGLKLCVATATDHALSEGVLKKLGLLERFAFVLTCRDVQAGKDSPRIYDCAAEKLGLRPDEVVIFEDAIHCIQTAKRAGYTVVGVYDESLERDGELEEAQSLCDRYIYDYRELLEERNTP